MKFFKHYKNRPLNFEADLLASKLKMQDGLEKILY